jgi:uncharacterized protein (DUF1330 family)
MIEILVGANVVDPAMYTEYRAQMTPLLEAYGGSFGVDVLVAEVLRAPEPVRFNRLFTMRSPSVERMDTFFAHPEYLAVRKRLFEPSVSEIHQLARYQVLPSRTDEARRIAEGR